MNTKIAAVVSAVTSFLGWFITLDPSQQTSVVAPIINAIPPGAQVYVAGGLKLVGAVSGVYALFRLRNMHPPDAPNINKP